MSKPVYSKNNLIFYGATVVVVLVLFRFTSAYGEAHLKPPPNLNGRYLTMTAPPGCPEASQLAITIQQSGIYLNGSMALAQTETATADTIPPNPVPPEMFSLEGLWQQQVQLTGQTTALANCLNSPPIATVSLVGTIVESPEVALTGQLRLEQAQPWEFTAKRQVSISAKPDH